MSADASRIVVDGRPLAFESGERARIVLVNTLHEPTIVHWHGLAVDTANDGAGMVLDGDGGRRNRFTRGERGDKQQDEG